MLNPAIDDLNAILRRGIDRGEVAPDCPALSVIPHLLCSLAVWDAHRFGPAKTLDTHVYALRHKFGDALTIQAVRGVGFRLTTGPETSPRPCAS